MPNNSSARQKKQSKKKKTVSPPLHKKDKAGKDTASMEGNSLSLFDAGRAADKASEERNSLSLFDTGSAANKANEELDSLSLYSGEEGAIDPSDPKFLERVLLKEFRSGLTQDERRAKRQKLRSEIRKANPGISDEDLKPMLTEAMVAAAREARKRKSQSAKDSPLSLLPLGDVKRATSLSSSAEPKTDSPLHWKNSLSLTDEERAAVRAETRAANPCADEKEFAMKYKLDLW